jgi:hypothetical protein
VVHADRSTLSDRDAAVVVDLAPTVVLIVAADGAVTVVA